MQIASIPKQTNIRYDGLSFQLVVQNCRLFLRSLLMSSLQIVFNHTMKYNSEQLRAMCTKCMFSSLNSFKDKSSVINVFMLRRDSNNIFIGPRYTWGLIYGSESL